MGIVIKRSILVMNFNLFKLNSIAHDLFLTGFGIGFLGVDVAVSYNLDEFAPRPFEFGNKFARRFKNPPFMKGHIIHGCGNP